MLHLRLQRHALARHTLIGMSCARQIGRQNTKWRWTQTWKRQLIPWYSNYGPEEPEIAEFKAAERYVKLQSKKAGKSTNNYDEMSCLAWDSFNCWALNSGIDQLLALLPVFCAAGSSISDTRGITTERIRKPSREYVPGIGG